MNIISAIMTMICQVFMAIFGPLIHRFRRFRPKIASAPTTDDQSRKKIVLILAVVVIAGSLLSLFFTMRPVSTEKINRNLFIGLGQTLADETAKALNNKGRIVVVVGPDFLVRRTSPHLELEAFQKELQKHGSINIVATEQVAVPETDPDQNLPRSQFEKIVNQFPRPAAIVSFIGLPPLEPENPLTVPSDAPKIIAIFNISSTAKAYLKRSIATSLIVPHQSSGSQPLPAQTPREAFDRYYRVCTTANYESIPD